MDGTWEASDRLGSVLSRGCPINTKVYGRDYRFLFASYISDNEIKGIGNHYTATFWEYDSRIGRRWNLDPKPNPSISQYNCFAGNPIFFTDPLGDTIRTNQEGFNIINEGLIATLGEGHGFSYDKDKGIVNYNVVEGKEYTKDQQNIISRYTKLINDKKSTNVTIVDHNEGIGILGGKSLADYGFNGVTLTPTDFSSFNVFIARNPKEVGEIANPAYNPFKEDGTPATILGFININTYYRGVASLHEIGGHAYLRLTQPKLEQANHNTLVENFETNFRQFYKIGTYTTKREVKRARKKGLDVQIGSPKYLGGSADKH